MKTISSLVNSTLSSLLDLLIPISVGVNLITKQLSVWNWYKNLGTLLLEMINLHSQTPHGIGTVCVNLGQKLKSQANWTLNRKMVSKHFPVKPWFTVDNCQKIRLKIFSWKAGLRGRLHLLLLHVLMLRSANVTSSPYRSCKSQYWLLSETWSRNC